MFKSFFFSVQSFFSLTAELERVCDECEHHATLERLRESESQPSIFLWPAPPRSADKFVEEHEHDASDIIVDCERTESERARPRPVESKE